MEKERKKPAGLFAIFMKIIFIKFRNVCHYICFSARRMSIYFQFKARQCGHMQADRERGRNKTSKLITAIPSQANQLTMNKAKLSRELNLTSFKWDKMKMRQSESSLRLYKIDYVWRAVESMFVELLCLFSSVVDKIKIKKLLSYLFVENNGVICV